MICILYATVIIVAGVKSEVPFDEDAVSKVIEAAFKCHNNPALAVSVVRDGQKLLSKGYGVTDIEKGTPVTSTTLFSVASLTKSFTTLLLVKLLHENTNLTVDSRVRELLGDKFKMPDRFRTLDTTFADLMSHRTGVPANNYLRFDDRLTRENLIERLHLLPSPKQFRVQFHYSNLMYGLLTRLTEIIGRQRWEHLISEHFFQLLDMSSSTFASVTDFTRPDVAAGYANKNGTYSKVHPEFSKRWAELAGSGSLMTSSDDMVKWMNFHLHNGLNMMGQQVMSAEHLAEVRKPRFIMPVEPTEELRIPEFPVTLSIGTYAFGFGRGFYRGYELHLHIGVTDGYRAYLSMLPAQNIGVFMVLTGEDESYDYRVPQVMYLLDRALGLEPWLNITTLCSYPEPWRAKPKPPSSPAVDPNGAFKYALQLYEGTYYNSAYGFLQVNYTKDLAFIMTYGWGKWQLLHLVSKNKNSTEQFYGKALEFTQLDVYPIIFVTKILEGNVIIVRIKVTMFEPETPPIFDKVDIKYKFSK